MGDDNNKIEPIDQLKASVKDLQEEIASLRTSLRMTDGYKRDMATAAEEVILKSPLVVIGKWCLGSAIAIGVAVWLGGSIMQASR